jgi:hypothetical protein
MAILHDQVRDFMIDWIEDHLSGFTAGSITALNLGFYRYIFLNLLPPCLSNLYPHQIDLMVSMCVAGLAASIALIFF